MCIFLILLFLGPRAASLIWWLFNPVRFELTFNTWIVPLIGILFVPWTTLMYTLVGLNGISGWDWLWLGLAFLIDLASYSGGAYSQKDRIPGYQPAANTGGTA